jgi:hypothetical protein
MNIYLVLFWVVRTVAQWVAEIKPLVLAPKRAQNGTKTQVNVVQLGKQEWHFHEFQIEVRFASFAAGLGEIVGVGRSHIGVLRRI